MNKKSKSWDIKLCRAKRGREVLGTIILNNVKKKKKSSKLGV